MSDELDERYNDVLQENGVMAARLYELHEELREARLTITRLRQENERLQSSVIRARYDEAEHVEEHGDEDRY